MKSRTLLISLMFIALLSFLLGLKFGSVALSWKELVTTILIQHTTLNYQLLVDIRLPRVLCAFTTGGLLSLSGVLMQVLLRNPLADPYILGVSGGAAITTLISILFGFTLFWQTGLAFIGALIAIFLVFGLARGWGIWSPTRLLLTGVVVSSGFAALISLILTLSPNRTLHSMLFWLLGDLNYAKFPTLGLCILFFGFLSSLYFSRELNIFCRGEIQAKSLGINTDTLNLKLYFLSAILTATAVSLAGSIGFVGLIVPHMIRLISNNDHRYLIPSSVLLGGSLLTLADTIARTILSPEELPVGIITALLGVPVFLYLLNKDHEKISR